MRGVEVRVGGGTSIMPRIAPTLYEFVGLDDGEYLKVAEACFRIFDRQDFLRVNRARARIKVLVDKIGIDAFREMVDEELQGDWVAERDFDVAGLRFDIDEEALAPAPPQSYASPNGDGTAYERYCADNVQAQRQHGFSTVHVKVTRGDLTPEQLRGIAEIMRRYSGGFMRTTVHQNFLLRWVRDETVYEVWRALDELGLADTGPDTITDVVSCPGTDSCKLGITSSMGLNAALQQRLEEMQITDPLTRALHIKMSGCPNGCSQHHIANIGFYGASIKVGEHTIPAYVAHVAGNFEGGEIVYGQRLKVRLPAKRVPDAVERWLRWYEAEREDERAVQRLHRARRHEGLRGQGPRSRDAGRVRPRDDDDVHRLEPRRAVQGRARRGRVRGLDARHRSSRGLAHRDPAAWPPRTSGSSSCAPFRRRSR